MNDTPIPRNIVDQARKESGLADIGKASIREVVRLVNNIEKASGQKFIKMEMGVPGLPAVPVGLEAQISALNNGVASIYPSIDGIPELKKEASRFAKLFLDIDIDPSGCVPTVGSMQAGMTAFMINGRCHKDKEYTLFIDPGFPVQKQQHQVLGLKYKTFDVYEHRGPKLRDKLEEYLSQNNIHTIVYSNPNNPSWICLSENELRSVGELADKYDVIIVEDLAYFGMDFRRDYSHPGKPPCQPTVAHYTDNYVILFSGSKVFSYAGERIALMMISDKLFARHYPDLKRFFTSDNFGHAAIYGALYAISSGTSHSAQYALAAMLKAANEGSFNFIETVREYGDKARVMKELFTRYGFRIVYDRDEGLPLADGFYFTVSYPGFSGSELLEELLYYGISAIALDITGSERSEGLRACVSQTQPSQFPDLEARLKTFRENHPEKQETPKM
jgi:aspartate/methionine/tyrosine aminotransferase